MMEYDVHTILDMLTLVATAAVIYQLRVKLVDTYQDDQDSVKTYYVVRGTCVSVLLCLAQMAPMTVAHNAPTLLMA